MAATSWRSAAAACWAGLLLLTCCNSEQQPSILEAHRQTLLDSAQQLEAAAAPTQYFSREFPHGSGAIAGRSWMAEIRCIACLKYNSLCSIWHLHHVENTALCMQPGRRGWKSTMISTTMYTTTYGPLNHLGRCLLSAQSERLFIYLTTAHAGIERFCIGRYHSSRFYGVHDVETLRSNKSGIGVSISKNLGIVTIAAVDTAAHYRNTQVSSCVLYASKACSACTQPARCLLAECLRRLTKLSQYAHAVEKPSLITTGSHAQAVWLGGTTVLIDQPYPSFPDNMGHWAEVLVPLYNLLTSTPWRQSHTHVDTILFGNLQRSQLDVSLAVLAGLLAGLLQLFHGTLCCCIPFWMWPAMTCTRMNTFLLMLSLQTPLLQKVDWVWEMLKLVFAPATLPGQDLPRTIFYNDFAQVERREWLCIQEAVVIHDRQAARMSSQPCGVNYNRCPAVLADTSAPGGFLWMCSVVAGYLQVHSERGVRCSAKQSTVVRNRAWILRSHPVAPWRVG
jgi:hypothetical protein